MSQLGSVTKVGERLTWLKNKIMGAVNDVKAGAVGQRGREVDDAKARSTRAGAAARRKTLAAELEVAAGTADDLSTKVKDLVGGDGGDNIGGDGGDDGGDGGESKSSSGTGRRSTGLASLSSSSLAAARVEGRRNTMPAKPDKIVKLSARRHTDDELEKMSVEQRRGAIEKMEKENELIKSKLMKNYQRQQENDSKNFKAGGGGDHSKLEKHMNAIMQWKEKSERAKGEKYKGRVTIHGDGRNIHKALLRSDQIGGGSKGGRTRSNHRGRSRAGQMATLSEFPTRRSSGGAGGGQRGQRGQRGKGKGGASSLPDISQMRGAYTKEEIAQLPFMMREQMLGEPPAGPPKVTKYERAQRRRNTLPPRVEKLMAHQRQAGGWEAGGKAKVLHEQAVAEEKAAEAVRKAKPKRRNTFGGLIELARGGGLAILRRGSNALQSFKSQVKGDNLPEP